MDTQHRVPNIKECLEENYHLPLCTESVWTSNRQVGCLVAKYDCSCATNSCELDQPGPARRAGPPLTDRSMSETVLCVVSVVPWRFAAALMNAEVASGSFK